MERENCTCAVPPPDFPTYRRGDLDSCSDYSRARVADPPSDSRYRREEWVGWHTMYQEIDRTFGDDVDLVFFGDSLTIKWNEYPDAFWCDQFTTGDSCQANVRPIFEKYFGYPYNGLSLGIAGEICMPPPSHSILHGLVQLQ